MRRIWIGVGLLLALLALGLLVMHLMDRQLGEVSDTLQHSAEAEDWGQAVSLAQQAHEDWKQKWHLVAALTDHTDMDQIDIVFAQLEIYQQHQAKTEHAAACAWLSEAITNLEENHRLTWWNLL